MSPHPSEQPPVLVCLACGQVACLPATELAGFQRGQRWGALCCLLLFTGYLLAALC